MNLLLFSLYLEHFILPQLTLFPNRINPPLVLTVALVSLISFVLQWWQPLLLYQRDAFNAGEYWRLLGGQFVHTNWPHYGLNIAGLWLFALLFYTSISARTFTISLLLLTVLTALCLHWFLPGLQWYAGLSGAIYGLYLIGAADMLLNQKDYLTGFAVAGFILVKVGVDYWQGPVQDNATLIEARVVTEAHVYGVLSALLLIALYYCYSRYASRATAR